MPVPEKGSVTWLFYKEKVLSASVDYYDRTLPRVEVRGLNILHDNAPVHRSAVVTKYLEEHNIKTLPNPAYSPDLSPCDFWLNPYIKAYLRGRRFWKTQRLGKGPFPVSKQYTQRCLQTFIFGMDKKMEKCVRINEEYFEGLT